MSYSKVNIDDVDDQAPGHGLESQESRFLRAAIGTDRIGIAHYRVKPNERFEFGHRHKSMEEAYVVLAGSGVFRVDDETVEVGARDVLAIDPGSWRGWEAGPDGMELLVVGEHREGDDESELDMQWWPRG